MPSAKYNQFIKSQMREGYSREKEKLIKIASFLRQEFNLIVHREAIITFNKSTDAFVDFSSWITEEQFHKYTIHVPDLLFFVGKKMWIIEVDGYIHDTNATVARKDKERNRIYNAAKLNWFRINEWEILLKQNKKPDRSATAEEIIQELREAIKLIV